MTVDCLIVGGGIAGLTAAYEAHRLGLSLQLVERRTNVGGVILTEAVDGFLFDAGPDSMLVEKRAAVDLCHELGLGDRLISTLEPRTAYVLRGGALHALPEGSVLGIPITLQALAASSLFSSSGKARIAAEVMVPRRSADADDDESIGAFVERRFGREAASYVAEPLLAGIHAGDVDRLSIRALFPRLVDAEREHGSVIRALRRQQRTRPRDGIFRSLAGGLGGLVSAVVDRLPAGTIRCNAEVVAIEQSEPLSARLAGGERIPARTIVVATPAHVTARLVGELDPELAALCREVPYVSSAAIVLAYPREGVEHPLAGSGFVVPRAEGGTLLAVSWISSKWPRRGPATLALMRGFIGGTRNPSIVDREDRELVALVDAELRPVLKIRARPVFQRVYRWHRANPQYEVGHLARIRAIDAALVRRPGLYVTGSGFRGVGIPDCVSDARTTVAALAAGLARIR